MTSLGRVLLIDDEPEIADMLRLYFTWHSYDFFHAYDGGEARDIASRVMPHVILMDLALPDTNGYALTLQLRLRPRTAHIPIILLSRWSSRDQRLTGLALGADDYIPKPFDLQELLLRVQNSMARAARDQLTDLRTGLPAAYTARTWLDEARNDPSQAIIEVILEHSIPYYTMYGNTAGADVYRAVGDLLLTVVNHKGSLDDFIGYLDEDHFVIISAQANARNIGEQITAVFNDTVSRYYSEADRKQGAIHLPNGSTFPFMRLVCRITSGSERIELS